MVVTRSLDARVEGLEKAMEELNRRFEERFQELRELLINPRGPNSPRSSTFASCTTLHLSGPEVPPPVSVPLPSPAIAAPPAWKTAPLVPSTPPPPALIATAHLLLYSHVVPLPPPPPPPHLPFPLQRSSPLPSIQQPIVFNPVSFASQQLPPVTVPDPVCVYSVVPLLHSVIMLKGLWSRLLHPAGVDLWLYPCVRRLQSFGRQTDVRPRQIWAVF